MATAKQPANDGILLIAENRRARHNYSVGDTYEAGIVLTGTEVKSLREKRVNFSDAYAILKNMEVFLLGLKIERYAFGTHQNHEPEQTRKLLLHKKEIEKLYRATREKGSTLVPLKLYFKRGRAKVLIGVAKGKSDVDKRQDLKRRDADREVARVMRRG